MRWYIRDFRKDLPWTWLREKVPGVRNEVSTFEQIKDRFV